MVSLKIPFLQSFVPTVLFFQDGKQSNIMQQHQINVKKEKPKEQIWI